MMIRVYFSLAVLGAALSLAGCNETTGGAMAGPVAEAPQPSAASRESMSLPSGAACSSEINKYQSVLRGDLDTGNVAQSVYDQIQGELSRAASACSAGKGAEAHKIVAASKARHGYRA